MRVLATFIAMLFFGALGYLAFAHLSGGAVPTFGLPLGGERAKIRHRALQFYEHVKFRNASALANFVEKDTSAHEIEEFLEKSFGAHSREIDLRHYLVDSVELDSSKARARVRMVFDGQNLNTKQPLSRSVVVFFFLQDGNWLIDTKNVSP